MKLTVTELFAGVGGFRVGLNHIQDFDATTGRAIEEGPWQFVWANQWEPSTKVQHAFHCYTTRFGVAGHINEDINKVDKTTIPDHNLLVGGFPCQDYSVARSLSNEKGIEGKKGVLFWDIRDVLIAKKPSFVLLENVDRLLKSPASQRGRDFAIMLRTFHDLGYFVEWRVINAAEYGMPQKRRRVFIFAYKQDSKYGQSIQASISSALASENDDTNLNAWLSKSSFFNTIFPIETYQGLITETDLTIYEDVVAVSNAYKGGKFLTSGIMVNDKVYHMDAEPIIEAPITLGETINTARPHETAKMDTYVIADDKVEKWRYLKGNKRIERTRPNGEIYYYSEGAMNFPDDLNVAGRTMLTSEATTNRSSHIVLDSELGKYRTITEVEAELLQMFPPNWTNTGMTKRNRYFMMGNALVTGVISRLEPTLRKIIENE